MKTVVMDKKTMKKRNLKHLAFWTIAWTASTALATFGSIYLWDGNAALTSLVVILNLGIGVGMVLANRRFIEGSDELEKKIQLESMGITLGFTLIVGIAYSLLDSTNVIPGDAEIGYLVIFMGLCYIISTGLNQKRYR